MTSRPNGPGNEISRRGVVRAGALAAPLVLTGRALAARGRSVETLKVGLIGCGGRGTGAAAQALKAEDGTIVLTAIGDFTADRLGPCIERLRKGLGDDAAARVQVPETARFAGLDAWKQVMDSGVDVVILTTPPAFRPMMLAAAIERGLHVFAEKPVAVDAPGVRSVMESARLAKERNLGLVVGFCWRFNVRHRALWKRVHEGAIGDLRTFYSTYNTGTLGKHPRKEGWSDVEWQVRNWQHFNWLSGDHIVEQAVHCLDQQAWAFQDVPPLSVTANGGRQAREGAESGDIYDHFAAAFEYPNGARALHQSRQMDGCSNDNNAWMTGTKGDATCLNWAPEHFITGENEWDYEGPSNDMYQQEHDELFASIRAGSPLNTGALGARSTMLAIMTRMSAYTGQTITWEQALASQESLMPDPLAWDTKLPLQAAPIPGRTKFL